jgi:hypothetical protein
MKWRTLIFTFVALGILRTPSLLFAEGSSGPYPREIESWTDEIKAAQRASGQSMLAFVTGELQRGEKNILVPEGDYRFAQKNGSTGAQFKLDLSAYDGVTVDFQGSTFWFETPDRGFDFVAGGNTIRNFTVDWDPLPFVQGRVTAIDTVKGAFHVRLDPGYEKARASLPNGIRAGRAFFFDEAGNFVTGQAGCSIHFSWDWRTEAGEFRVGYNGFYGAPISAGGFKVGDRVALLVRKGIGMQIWGGREGCALENVTFLASPSLVFATAGGHSPTLRNCAILRRPGTNRLMSGNADGFNFSNTSKGPLMENCRVEGAIGDDFVNVHGHLARVIWQDSPTELVVTRMNWRGDIGKPVTVEFFDRKTLKSYGKRIATGKFFHKSWKVEKDKCRADLGQRWHSGDAAGLIAGNTISVHRLTLDAPLETEDDVIVACEEFSGVGAVIRNCSFAGSSATGIRMQAPYATIENNVVENTGGPGITLYGQPSFWGEGPFVHHTKVIGNTIRNTGLFSAQGNRRAGIILNWTPPEAGNLVKGNTLINPGSSAIIVSRADGLVIEDNTISGSGNLPPWTSQDGTTPEGEGYGIAVTSSHGVVLRNNTLTAPGPHARGEVFHPEAGQ